jgi:1-acyl-sn-glycerol-3-phosphate acyltransferase
MLLLIARFSPGSPWIDQVVRGWGRAWLTPAGVRVTVEGCEHIDTGRGYVIVSNHLSNLDIMAHFVGLPIPIRFLAKRELYRVPVFGPAMRAIGIIEVDRAQADVEEINRQAAENLSAGRSIIAYPEGGRSRDGTLGAFKSGAFAIAIANGAPVCPMTTEGSRRCWAPGERRVHRGEIRVVVGDVIDTTGLGADDIEHLRDETRGVIESTYRHLTTTSSLDVAR